MASPSDRRPPDRAPPDDHRPIDALPIDALRRDFDASLDAGPVVLSAPTGSGKSTQVPRWCAERGPVIVVEPRRVACRALAARVAELEGCALGDRVGYQVRGEARVSAETRICFLTPGIALRQMDRLQDAAVVILDELHERRLDVDLLLALLPRERLCVMSATFDAERVARHLSGRALRGEGRPFPVEMRYRGGELTLPSAQDLETRVAEGVAQAFEQCEGDVLVFLPGKGEIQRAADALRLPGVDILTLHGGQPLKEQAQVLRQGRRRRVVLATNVAETSLTVPGIGAVVDSGLVRRTTYHRGRAHLALLPIATDAADQRAGRAGRTGPGVCIRLWAQRASLDAATPPEIHRESLVPLVLAALAAGGAETAAELATLPFLDPPRPHALDDARAELEALGALREDRLTETGRALFGLPLDAHLGRLLVEAQREVKEGGDPELLQDVVDLVAALGVDRPLFREAPKRHEDPLRADACDASGLVRALREGGSGVSPIPLADARRSAARLRDALGLGDARAAHVDPAALRGVALRADPRSAHVARRRTSKRSVRVAFSAGGTELALARESAAWLAIDPAAGTPPAEALVVFDSRAFGTGRERRRLITCASPASLHELRVAGVGRERLSGARIADGRVVAIVERVHAGKVLDEEERVPEGAAAREAMATLFEERRLFRRARETTERRLRSRALAAKLSKTRVGKDAGLPLLEAPPSLRSWALARLEALGVESGHDLALLAEDDLVAEALPDVQRAILEEAFPEEIEVGGATYAVDYDLPQRQVLLRIVRGSRTTPPPAAWLPRFAGFRVCVEAGRRIHVVRER